MGCGDPTMNIILASNSWDALQIHAQKYAFVMSLYSSTQSKFVQIFHFLFQTRSSLSSSMLTVLLFDSSSPVPQSTMTAMGMFQL